VEHWTNAEPTVAARAQDKLFLMQVQGHASPAEGLHPSGSGEQWSLRHDVMAPLPPGSKTGSRRQYCEDESHVCGWLSMLASPQVVPPPPELLPTPELPPLLELELGDGFVFELQASTPAISTTKNGFMGCSMDCDRRKSCGRELQPDTAMSALTPGTTKPASYV
jgi:hypothetical protein